MEHFPPSDQELEKMFPASHRDVSPQVLPNCCELAHERTMELITQFEVFHCYHSRRCFRQLYVTLLEVRNDMRKATAGACPGSFTIDDKKFNYEINKLEKMDCNWDQRPCIWYDIECVQLAVEIVDMMKTIAIMQPYIRRVVNVVISRMVKNSPMYSDKLLRECKRMRYISECACKCSHPLPVLNTASTATPTPYDGLESVRKWLATDRNRMRFIAYHRKQAKSDYHDERFYRILRGFTVLLVQCAIDNRELLTNVLEHVQTVTLNNEAHDVLSIFGKENIDALVKLSQ